MTSDQFSLSVRALIVAVTKPIVVLPHFPLDFPGTASIAVHVDSPFWVATRLAPSAGLVVV